MPGIKLDVIPFASPWPNTIHLGKSGFIIVGKGSFGQPEVFELTASGEATFIFQVYTYNATPPPWKKVTFKVSKVAFDSLLSGLKAKVSTLNKTYDTNVEDGTQAFLSISDGTEVRTVWMNNYFPEEFRKILRATGELINSEHFTVTNAESSNPQAARAISHKAFSETASTRK